MDNTVKTPVIIIGAGGHARVLISTLKALRREIAGILHPEAAMIGQTIDDIPVLGNDDKIQEYAPDSVELVNGIGSISSTGKRREIYEKFKKDGYSFATVVHLTAIVMDDVVLGEGAQVMAGAVIQIGCTIGDNAFVNTGAIVDHDCVVGDHTHVAPGAVLSGGVHLGAGGHIGTGAVVIQGIYVGENATIGAGAVVIRDVPSSQLVLGNPARERRPV
jgi:sugar O-acyltransferase (sialic acid O-acetyltransferase NeuD family)